MKLKNKTFPFWGYQIKKNDVIVYRFINKSVNNGERYHYDILIRMIHGIGNARKYNSPALSYFMKSTLGSFKDVQYLHTTGKRVVLQQIFKLDR